MTPEVKRLVIAALRAAGWLPLGPLVEGCVHDDGRSVRLEVREAIAALKAQDQQ